MIKQLSKDITTLRKSGEKDKVMKLSYIKSLLQENSKAKKPKKEVDVLKAYRKQLLKSMEDYEGMESKCREIYEEVQLVKTYIPVEMSEDEIRFIVQTAILKLDEVNMKTLMKEIMPQLKGKADPSIVTKIVKEYIQ